MINWPRLLDQYHIEWQHGSGDNIEVHCPFCGNADEGKHLSISTKGNGFRCWRRPEQHSGKGPLRILTSLLKITFEEAKAIAGYNYGTNIDSSNLAVAVRGLINRNDISIVPIKKAISFPEGFRRIDEGRATLPVFNYIIERGYTETQARGLIHEYNLHTTLSGSCRFRVVIPIYMPNIGMVNWTARSIEKHPYLRYRELTTDPETSRKSALPQAVLNKQHTLWNFAEISKSREKNLFICEGPFDAIRLDYFGVDHSTRATCVFGKTISDYQISLLENVRNRYDNLYLVLDQDAERESLGKLGRLSHLSPKFRRLPSGIKDPDGLQNMSQLRKFIG